MKREREKSKKSKPQSKKLVRIVEFKELLDGNFMLVLEGKSFLRAVNYNPDLSAHPDINPVFEIDLRQRVHSENQALHPMPYLTHTKRFLALRKKNQLMQLKKDTKALGKRYKSLEMIKDEVDLEDLRDKLKSLESEFEKLVNDYCRKYGFDAVYVPAVNNHIRKLISEKKNTRGNEDEDKDKREQLLSKLQKIMRAVSHTDERRRIYVNFSLGAFKSEVKKIKEEADALYAEAIKCCQSCEGGSVYDFSRCPKEKRRTCRKLIEHMSEQGFADDQFRLLVLCDNKSKYGERKLQETFPLDKSMMYSYKRYAAYLSSEDMIASKKANEALAREILRRVDKMTK